MSIKCMCSHRRNEGSARPHTMRGACLLLAITFLHIGSALANGSLAYEPIPDAAPVPLDPVGPTTVADTEAFVDGFMASRLATGRIAGAVVSVVKDGALFFAKGYGYADVAEGVTVDPERTLFRIASISKVFTWIAVMQLVEQGALDLDEDVNVYLKDLKIPEAYGRPITLRNLMTHTAGLEDGTYLYPDPQKPLTPMGEWLGAHMPARVRPPTTDFTSGTNAAYSNWGASLAGYIVATVSGLPFDEYVERHIFEPLGMRSSTSREPLPPAFAPRMSKGYLPGAGGFTEGEFEIIKPHTPAGSLTSSATDMARFMLALLNEGSLDGARILAAESLREMFTRTLSPDPAVNGTALGVYENYINGRRVVGHGGDTRYFHSTMSLVPEANLGFFMAINTGGEGSWAAEELMRAFVQHYFPARLPQVKPPSDAVQRNALYVGRYRSLSRTYTAYEKIFSGLDDLTVEALPDGKLLFAEPLTGIVARWVEVGDGVFRIDNDDVFVAFKGERGGPATHLVGPFAPTAVERVYWYDTVAFHAIILLVAVVTFVSMGVSGVRQRERDRTSSASLRWARPTLVLAGALLAAAVLGLFMHFQSLLGAQALESAALLHGALTLALLAVVPTVAAIVFTVLAWRQSAWTFAARLHYSFTTVAALAFLWVLNYWNLLGYHFG